MAFIAASRVLETFTTTGTGTVTLAGAVTGYRTFASAMSNADTCFYFMEGGSDYEIGLGTYSAGTLARTTVLKSSNSNAAVNWAAGTKTVGIDALGPNDKTYVARVQVFTGSGTYTPSPGMIFCIIECIGGGGAGGGAQSAAGSNHCAGGGGSGGYSRHLATSADIGASKTVTIGAAGAGVSAAAGGAGGDTSVGVLCIGKGGSGGGQSVSGGLLGAAGAGGVAGTGNILTAAGMSGGGGFGSTTITSFGPSGAGGSSAFGGGGAGLTPNAPGNGTAASNYGSGGSGACGVNATTARTGGAGSAGLVIITEFIA